MEFDWSQEVQELRAGAERFAAQELNAGLPERDQRAEFSRAGWESCARFGVMGMLLPVESGGSGLGLLDFVHIASGLARGCQDNGLLSSISAHVFGCAVPLLRHGSADQKKLLPKLASGELIGALALTEPEAGSDAFHLRASARREGDGWALNGTKVFVTNAPIADLFTVFATVDPAKDMRGLCCFLVEKGLPGVRIGRNLPKAGLRTSPWAEVVLDDCRIPAGSLLGREGGGAAVFNDAMEWERIGVMAWSLGAMERQLEACVRYCGLRQQSGRPLSGFQAVSHKLADMKVRCEAGRLLLYRAAWFKQRGRNCHAEAAQAKLFVSEAYVKNSLEAVQLHGAFGYAAESGLERELRDALAGTIHSGTSEIQRNIIASALD